MLHIYLCALCTVFSYICFWKKKKKKKEKIDKEGAMDEQTPDTKTSNSQNEKQT